MYNLSKLLEKNKNKKMGIKFTSFKQILIMALLLFVIQTNNVHAEEIYPDGKLDSSFYHGTATGPNYIQKCVKELSTGKILVGNRPESTSFSGKKINGLYRLNTDGSLDETFNVAGTGIEFEGWTGVTVFDEQSDGKILVGGRFSSYNGTAVDSIIRLNADGSLDETFDTGTGFSSSVYAIAIQGDGKIIVGGGFTTYKGVTANRIIRLNADGSVDSSFDTGTGFNTTVYNILLQSSGEIIVGGKFTTYDGVTANRITRLNTDGSLDDTFNSGGTGIDEGRVEKMIIQSDDKILFTNPGEDCELTYNGTPIGRLTRLNADGTIDTDFNSGEEGADSKIKGIATGLDNSIFIAGRFQAYNGTNVAYLAKLGLPDALLVGPIAINDNYAYTPNSDVTLTFNPTDEMGELSEMMVSNNSDFTDAEWEDYEASKSWDLIEGYGQRTVYAKFKDNKDNLYFDYNDSILVQALSNYSKKIVLANTSFEKPLTFVSNNYTKTSKPKLQGANPQAKNGEVKIYKKDSKGHKKK